MIIKYKDNMTIRKREEIIEEIFSNLPYRYCFISGSFIFNEKYKDIDVFVITRSKKIKKLKNKKIKIQSLDFNDLHSLFYHSISKDCVAKNILPKKVLRVTMSDYWSIINETVPTILNEKKKFRKHIRDLIMYTAFFKKDIILGSSELNQEVRKFRDPQQVMAYINKEIPKIFQRKARPSYIKRFFYTESGGYKDLLQYDSHRFLYELSHSIIKGIV